MRSSPMARATLAVLVSLYLFAPSQALVAQPTAIPAADALRPDPRLVQGVLPNGMHYLLIKNATPKGQASLRLRIGAGSLQEADDQQGLAHVLEHMAFKGSTHVPNGEMIKLLERQGLAFGPDTNAFTAWTQTVYMLDVPETAGAGVDTALMLLRETAGELTLAPEALEPERGVVLSEERLRDTPEYRASIGKLKLQLAGRLAAERLPIGKVEVIRNAPVSRLAAYYHDNYRPETATLIAVGDFDLQAMEAQIKSLFSNWTDAAPAKPVPDLGVVAPSGLKTQLAIIPGASTRIEISWLRPFDASPDSVARRRRETVEQLALAVLNRRFERLAQLPAPPFLAAESGASSLFRSAQITALTAVSAPDHWRDALSTLEQEGHRLAQFGVTADELSREVVNQRTQLVNAVAGEATRPTPELASQVVEAQDDQSVFTSPGDDLALFDATVAHLTPDEVTASARQLLSGSGPFVQISTPEAIEGGETKVAEVFKASLATPVTGPIQQAQKVWSYSDFGPPSAVASRTAITDLGVTRVVFANGVKLLVKRTDFQADQTLVQVRFPGGRGALKPDAAPATWATSAFALGGLTKLSFDDLQQVLNGRTYAMQADFGDEALLLRGQTKPADLAVQLQVLAAYAQDPAYRPDAFERLRVAMATALRQMDATAMGVFSRDGHSLIANGDLRFAYPDVDALKRATPEDLKRVLQHDLHAGPAEVVIVGDVAVEDAIKAVADTFGAASFKAQPTQSAPLTPVAFHPPGETVEVHHGRPDQAAVLVGWPICDFRTNPQAARAAIILGEVMKNRVIDEVRISQGATYSPMGRAEPSETFKGFGSLVTMIETTPEKVASFRQTVGAIADALAKAPPTADELLRAVKPHQEQILKAQQTNGYWLARLDGASDDAGRLDLIRTSVSGYGAVTPGDIQAAAKTYLVPEKAWTLIIKPPAGP